MNHSVELSINEIKVIWFALHVTGVRAPLDEESILLVENLYQRFSQMILDHKESV